MTRCACNQREVCAEPFEPECGLGKSGEHVLVAADHRCRCGRFAECAGLPAQVCAYDYDRLRAEVARLKEERDTRVAELQRAAMAALDAMAQVAAQRDAKDAELERWQEAVRWHAATLHSRNGFRWNHSDGEYFVLGVANSIALRASLSGAG